MINNNFERNIDPKNMPKRPKYIINPNSNYEDPNMYFKNSNLINEPELIDRKNKINQKNDLLNQSSQNYKFRDCLSDNNNKNNENLPSRATYIGNLEPNYCNESKTSLLL